MTINIVNKSHNELPAYESLFAAGMDMRANLSAPVLIKPLERKLIPTGLFISIPNGYHVEVRPRSGLALKKGITVLNSPGTVDPDYRGELCVILINLSNEDFVVNNGDRIAQMVAVQHQKIEWNEVEILDDTQRGTGGFGSTGKE